MKKEDKLVRMHRYWHYQRIKIERRLEELGDRIEYSATIRKESISQNQPFKP